MTPELLAQIKAAAEAWRECGHENSCQAAVNYLALANPENVLTLIAELEKERMTK